MWEERTQHLTDKSIDGTTSLKLNYHHILWITILTIHNPSSTLEAYKSSASEFF